MLSAGVNQINFSLIVVFQVFLAPSNFGQIILLLELKNVARCYKNCLFFDERVISQEDSIKI